MLAAATSLTELLSFGDKGYGDELAWGVLNTIQISIFGYAFGLALGLLGAVGKLSGGKYLRYALDFYTTIGRAVPELVLILLLYYAGTDSFNALIGLFGHDPVQVNGMVAAIFVLGLVQGAYSTEVLRAAIQAVPIGQLEAARAYGMTPWKMFSRVTLPAMLPNAIPGLANLWLNITKDSALISVVGFTELALATRQAAGVSKQYFLLYVVAQIIYLTISNFSGFLFNRLEQRVRRGQPKLV
ncbi:MAG: ABC transporter permease subunit [Alphaproteobacteria bacterium]|nr:ABC transporter permease subunit [Alphaproteobacteria bacterium]